jgi:hypothetical protein
MRTCRPLATVALTVLLAAAGLAPACGFIEGASAVPTLRQGATQSELVLYGTLNDPRHDAGGDSTTLAIETVLKAHPALEGRKTLRLPRHIPIEDPRHPPHCLVFCDVYRGQIDPFRMVPATRAVIEYLKGLLVVPADDSPRRLRYCFDHLDHADKGVAEDAFQEFIKSPDAEIGQVGRLLSAAKLRTWLRDPATPLPRLRLYGFLLGNCGGAADATLLRELTDRLVRQQPSWQIDAILTGYTLLTPREGWPHVCRLAGDPSLPFAVRFAAQRAARFFHNVRPDFLPKEEILAVPAALLEQPDIADIPIEDLRRWRCWDLTERILPLYDKMAPDNSPVLRRATLRYALQSPGAAAQNFVARLRKSAPDLVEDTEDWLLEEASSGNQQGRAGGR